MEQRILRTIMLAAPTLLLALGGCTQAVFPPALTSATSILSVCRCTR